MSITMKSNSEFVIYAVKLNLFLILCVSIVSTSALDTGTVAPLNADSPVLSEKILDNKDLKKLETRFHDPPPEYYK